MLNETIYQFYARFLKLSANCDFADKNKEMKSRVILNSSSNSLRRYGLREQPTLQELITYGKTMESTSYQLSTIDQQSNQEVNNVNVIFNNKFNKRPNKNTNTRNKLCKNCGNEWHQNGKQSLSCNKSQMPHLPQNWTFC